MDTELFKIIAYVIGGGVLLLLVVRALAKPKKCEVCSTETKDSYRNENDTTADLCRNHLIERWKKDVTGSSVDMVVIEPDLINYPYAYLYASIARLGVWQYPKTAQDNIATILDSIKGKMCKECSAQASVAFFKKEDYECPFFETLKPAEIFLCKNCVVKRIEPHLRSSKENLLEGLYAPTNERGVYHVQEF